VCHKHGLSTQTVCLEEYRRGTSLEHVGGHCTDPERWRAGEWRCHEKQGREHGRTPRCRRGMLYREEDQTVRPLLGLALMRVMVVGLWMVLKKMMDQVGARHHHEGEERQDGTERLETHTDPAHVPPAWSAACGGGTHREIA
jgi:hypothetical protein